MNKCTPNTTTHESCLAEAVVGAFVSVFRGRTDVWGTLTGRCVKEEVTPDHYCRHLCGKVSLGIYPLLNDGTCYWVASDLDQVGTAPWHNGPDDAAPSLRLMEILSSYDVKQGLFLEKTKSKGWRVWLFFSDAIAAADARHVVAAAIEKAGLPSSIEIFPKQATIAGIRFGNYVNLPYFGGGPSGERPGRVMVDLVTLVPIPLLDFLRSAHPFPLGAMESVLNKLPRREPARKGHHNPEKVTEVLTRPLQIGERRATLVSLAGYLRSHGVAEEIAVILLLSWAEKYFAESLPPQEVEKHVRGIYQRYGTTALDIDEAQLVRELPNEIEEIWK